ncbi:hypothetical protein MPSEU_000744500 [Mayamaea pseudoterrestris]|nr:hypothetical protein MPSEU_000744500 [Mayamaea pseudoterrestris]
MHAIGDIILSTDDPKTSNLLPNHLLRVTRTTMTNTTTEYESVGSTQELSQAPFQGLDFPGSRAATNSLYAAGSRGPPSDAILLKTAGNALQAFSRHEIHDDDDFVAVSCPKNVNAGDCIRIIAPDGSGREIETIVPQGISVGQMFLVRLPPRPEDFHGTNSHPVFVVGTPASPTERPVVASLDLDMETATSIALDSLVTLPPPVATAVNDSSAPCATAVSDHHGQDLVLVKVPIGGKAGDKLHISTNKGQVIEATVPPNSTEFYVRIPAAAIGNNHFSVPPAHGVARQPPQPETPINKTTNDDSNLLLVQVPNGGWSGDQIQVTAPDGRIIEATIPPGNVNEFYIRVPSHAPGNTGSNNLPVTNPLGALHSFLGWQQHKK